MPYGRHIYKLQKILSFMESGDVKIQKFNSAIAFLIRLDNLQRQASYHSSTSGNLLKWHAKLSALYLELYPLIEKDEEKKFQTIMKSASEAARNYETITKEKKKDNSLRGEYSAILFQFEKLIKKAIHHNGLLLPSPKDPRFAVIQ